jgi:hypothetical protein
MQNAGDAPYSTNLKLMEKIWWGISKEFIGIFHNKSSLFHE